MKVFLTGATGLLGGHVLKMLTAKGVEVRALVRSTLALKNFPNVDRVLGDLRDVRSFEDKLSGSDVLIHAGACYSELYRGGAPSLPNSVNVKGTAALLEAAKKHQIKNIVYISSSAVLQSGAGKEVNESSPYLEVSDDPYFQSKVEAEKEVLQFSAAHPTIRIVLLLPSVMLGPGDVGPTPTGAFVKKLLSGEIKRLLPGHHRIVDVRDVAAAVCASIEKGRSGERYLIGGRRYEMAEIYQATSRASGRSMPTKRISAGKLLLLSRVATLISKVSGRPPFLKPGIVKRLQENYSYNSRKAEQELSVNFRSLDETMRDTVRWFQSANNDRV